MIYSKTCEYAMRALLYLCEDQPGVYKRTSKISQITGVPGPYLSKIFLCLVQKGILKSRRGAAGGVALCCDYEKLTLMQIVDAIDDLATFNECAMGLDRCDDTSACPLHEIWKRSKTDILTQFKNTKLIELTKKSKQFQYGQTKRVRLKTAG